MRLQVARGRVARRLGIAAFATALLIVAANRTLAGAWMLSSLGADLIVWKDAHVALDAPSFLEGPGSSAERQRPTRAWAAVNGQPPEPSAHAARPAIPAEPPSVLRVVRAADGNESLVYDEPRLAAIGHPVRARFDRICRFDQTRDTWVPVDWHYLGGYQPLTPRAADDPAPPRVFQSFGGNPGAYPGPGLLWIAWTEDHDPPGEAMTRAMTDRERPSGNSYSSLVHYGALCTDVEIGAAPAGRIAACVPGASSAEARFVPEPGPACHR